MSDRKEKRSKSEGGIPPGNLGQFPNENNRSIPDIAANVPLMESARDGQVRKERQILIYTVHIQVNSHVYRFKLKIFI